MELEHVSSINENKLIETGYQSTFWRAPSNIALVKYCGKKKIKFLAILQLATLLVNVIQQRSFFTERDVETSRFTIKENLMLTFPQST